MWSVILGETSDSTGKQLVTASWSSEENPRWGTFTYSKYIRKLYPEYVAFKNEAKAALITWQALRAELVEIEDWVVEMLSA